MKVFLFFFCMKCSQIFIFIIDCDLRRLDSTLSSLSVQLNLFLKIFNSQTKEERKSISRIKQTKNMTKEIVYVYEMVKMSLNVFSLLES